MSKKPIIALALTAVALLSTSAATAQKAASPAQASPVYDTECNRPAVVDAASLDADFQNTDSNVIMDCRAVPGTPGQTLIAFTEPVKRVGNDVVDYYSLYVLLVQTSPSAVLAKYSGHSAISSDAIAFNNLTLDMARYILAPGVRAFGVRADYNGSGGTGCVSDETLTLFVRNGNTLRPVLSELVVGNTGRLGSSKVTLSMAPSISHGYADIRLKGSEQSSGVDENDYTRCMDDFEPDAIKTQILHFDGTKYGVPKDLLRQ